MGKTVWILNHYATNMYYDKGGRHFFMAKYLKEKGYNPIIVCSNVKHNSTDVIEVKEGLYIKKYADDIPFVFVKTCEYENSYKKRVLSMIQYYKRVQKIARELPKPDVIIGSSVHPLACFAANKLAKLYRCQSICEIRDLWPESIIAYGILKKESLFAKLLYSGEKKMYKDADKVLMTWAGGMDYIRKQGWEKDIPADKVFHISNGVDIKSFMSNLNSCKVDDPDLSDEVFFKFVYAGSIRSVNNLRIIVDAAAILKKRGNTKCKILIYGDGDQREELAEYAKEHGLDNIVFKGRVEKKYIPYILSKAEVSVLHNTSTILDEYGQSQNKLFEYLAIGHPILMTYSVGHSVVKGQNCGIELDEQTSESIADAMEAFTEMPKEEYRACCKRTAEAAKEFDFSVLTDKLEYVIEN